MESKKDIASRIDVSTRACHWLNDNLNWKFSRHQCCSGSSPVVRPIRGQWHAPIHRHVTKICGVKTEKISVIKRYWVTVVYSKSGLLEKRTILVVAYNYLVQQPPFHHRSASCLYYITEVKPAALAVAHSKAVANLIFRNEITQGSVIVWERWLHRDLYHDEQHSNFKLSYAIACSLG